MTFEQLNRPEQRCRTHRWMPIISAEAGFASQCSQIAKLQEFEMKQRGIVLFSVYVLTATAILLGDEAEQKQLIQEGLSKACAKFDLTQERLTNSLLEDFDRAGEAARAKGTANSANAKRVDQLKEAKEKFAAEGTLPLPEVLGKPVDTFERSLNMTKKEMDQAYDKAISAATKLKLDSYVSELTSQKNQFEEGFAKRHPPRIVARWLHVVGRKGQFHFDFASDGRIIARDRVKRTWEINGKTLIIRSPDPKAPGSFWTDRCTISADGKTYKGRNQDRTEIQGTRVESD